MGPKTARWLNDIVGACGFIISTAHDRTLNDYENDRVLRAAIERHFEILGEALNRIRKSDPQTANRVPECSAIVAFRNILIHGYDLIDHKRVWEVIRRDVPTLRAQIATILQEEAGP
jgi:uncharacterized protein with HEPN domain